MQWRIELIVSANNQCQIDFDELLMHEFLIIYISVFCVPTPVYGPRFTVYFCP
jgi:hypothetical protein